MYLQEVIIHTYIYKCVYLYIYNLLEDLYRFWRIQSKNTFPDVSKMFFRDVVFIADFRLLHIISAPTTIPTLVRNSQIASLPSRLGL